MDKKNNNYNKITGKEITRLIENIKITIEVLINLPYDKYPNHSDHFKLLPQSLELLQKIENNVKQYITINEFSNKTIDFYSNLYTYLTGIYNIFQKNNTFMSIYKNFYTKDLTKNTLSSEILCQALEKCMQENSLSIPKITTSLMNDLTNSIFLTENSLLSANSDMISNLKEKTTLLEGQLQTLQKNSHLLYDDQNKVKANASNFALCKEFNKNYWIYLVLSFLFLIIPSAIIIYIIIAPNIFPEFSFLINKLTDALLGRYDTHIYEYLVSLIIFIPKVALFLWLLWFLCKKHFYYSYLSDDYKFKTAVAMTYIRYRDEIKNFNDDEEMLEHLYKSVLSNITKNPVDNCPKDINMPYSEFIKLIKDIIKK